MGDVPRLTEEQARDKDLCLSLAGADLMLSSVETTARGAFEKDGWCETVAILYTFNSVAKETLGQPTDHLNNLVLGTRFEGNTMEDVERAKDNFSVMIQKSARLLDAFAVAFVSESRTLRFDPITQGLPGETPEQALDRFNREREGKSFKDIPGAVEIVLVSFEHAALDGACVSMADIKREIPGDESSPGTLLPFVRMGGFPTGDTSKKGKSRGRFTNMSPGARGD